MAKARTNPETAAAPTDKSPTALAEAPAPSGSDIARRAYDLYLARGCDSGHDVEDWLQAERELRDTVGSAGG
jgi:Protein of unknown function (DUF2934)